MFALDIEVRKLRSLFDHQFSLLRCCATVLVITFCFVYFLNALSRHFQRPENRLGPVGLPDTQDFLVMENEANIKSVDRDIFESVGRLYWIVCQLVM